MTDSVGASLPGAAPLLKRLQAARFAFGGAPATRRETGAHVREMDADEWEKWCDELRAIEMALRAALEAGPEKCMERSVDLEADEPCLHPLPCPHHNVWRQRAKDAERRFAELTEALEREGGEAGPSPAVDVEKLNRAVDAMMEQAKNLCAVLGVRGESLPGDTKIAPRHISGCASEIGRPCNCGPSRGEEP